jgi:hypothetical protein
MNGYDKDMLMLTIFQDNVAVAVLALWITFLSQDSGTKEKGRMKIDEYAMNTSR